MKRSDYYLLVFIMTLAAQRIDSYGVRPLQSASRVSANKTAGKVRNPLISNIFDHGSSTRRLQQVLDPKGSEGDCALASQQFVVTATLQVVFGGPWPEA